MKQEIRAADSRIKQLDNYLKEKSYANYQQLADQLLPQLSYIQGRADTLKNISRLKFTSEFNGKCKM
ncbi:hypothetical protein HMPREF1042_2383 [Streptococcus constellatus subsp. pharyngis SK1060 = CCUG 46377]|uniref:Uncharacterized protein n=1 Tax=Streptococcus constellatus subsp. pharyngis SK1060 = CCUG 46377 TaxID=1035184 RepID=F9P9N4_STRCV|nr:hypothetical protein HMPREF1042_2383 [Streptococcus constellatus subsp. pharyngis SK1060 = CCUG 46377]